MKLMHGSRRPLALHIGICLTDDRAAAISYANRGGYMGTVATVELDLAGLRVVEVESFGEGETADACGDREEEIRDLQADGVDVVTFDDQDYEGDTHRTWRIISQRALERVQVL